MRIRAGRHRGRGPLALGLLGDSAQAGKLADILVKCHPLDTVINNIWVPEIRSINKLKEGQTAKVSMDTYPGVILDGDITRIASIADTGQDRWNRDPEVKKFTVEITLKGGEDLHLKPGISAKAEIFIDKRESTVYVPLQCVFLEEGKHLCWVQEGAGEPKCIEVTPGLSNDNFLEILSGLDPGQTVLLYNPRLGTPRAPGESGDKGEKGEGKAGDGKDEDKAETAAASTGAATTTP